MSAVAGGLSHRMWRLRTSAGEFAIKELNRDFANPHYVAWYERAFTFELRAYDAGVPMPRPIPEADSGRCLAELPGADAQVVTVRAHEWMDGEQTTRGPHSEDDAETIAGILSRLDALEYPADSSVPDLTRRRPQDVWDVLCERLRADGIAWFDELRRNLQMLQELEAFAVEADRTASEHERIMCHRDADPKNVLRRHDGQLLLIDWDASGPAIPRREFARQAVTWIGSYDPQEHLARAYVRGYRGAGGSPFKLTREDFGEMAGVLLRWCEFNVRRVLGERLAGEAERAIAAREARRELSNLPRLMPAIDLWIRLLS